MLSGDWHSLARIVAVGAAAYVGLVVLLRISGKRTLSKMNAFDLVVTVALGSTLATVLLSPDAALLDGLVAFSLLVGLQLGITWLAVRFRPFGRLIKSEPRLLLYRGCFERTAMQDERVTEGEILAAIRASGIPSVEEVEAVVLETAGTLSVVRRTGSNPPSALSHVRGWAGAGTAAACD